MNRGEQILYLIEYNEKQKMYKDTGRHTKELFLKQHYYYLLR